VLVGVDQMAFFASYLRHLLALLDLRAEVVASASQEALARLARIHGETLLIGLSNGRPHALVLRALKLAQKRDCSTVAITDASLSELTKLADYTLYYSSNSPSYTRSHSALLSLIQALAYAVYSNDEDAYQERIRAFKLK
jgi:DNA-binding MurR/RpiR family transcriptional regulator